MKKKGFTLTELIAAIVILSIIIALGVVTYTNIRKNVLEREYKNLVTYLESKAANYAENTGELNVTVERLIESGYVDVDNNKNIIDPRDNTSINCFLFDSKYENGNYVAKLSGSLGKDETGKCNNYIIRKDINICVEEENEECSIIIKEWYDKNIKLKVLIGGKIKEDAKIVWKIDGIDKEQGTYETTVLSIQNKVAYTAIVSYEEINPDGSKKVFEGTDTVPISIDLEKPKIEKIEVKKANEWTKNNKRVIVTISDNNGSGIKKIVFYNASNNKRCNDEGLPWIDYDGSTYTEALYNGEYRVCVRDIAGNISNDLENPIKVEKVDTTAPGIGNITQTAANTDSGPVTISTTISDLGSKLAAYAITDSSNEPTSWTTISGSPENKEVSKTYSTSGTYYIWAKDKAGNINNKSVSVIIKYKQTTRVRYENTDGTWTSYEVAEEKIVNKGSSYSWSRAADATYQAASVTSYTVTGDKTNDVSIYRNRYTCKISYKLQNIDGTYGTVTNSKNDTLRYGEICSWSRNATTTYQAANYSTIITSNVDETIEIRRKGYTCTKKYRLQNADGTWGSYVTDGSTTVLHGSSCSYEKSVTNYKGSETGANNTKGTASVSNVTSNQTLSISMYRNTYTVTFDSNGGSSVNGQVIKYGASVVKPNNPTKYGYQFKEWQLNGIAYNFNSIVTENIILNAIWNCFNRSPIVIDHPNSNYFSIYYKYQNHLWQYYSKYGDINEVKSNGNVINMDYGSDLAIYYPNSNYFSIYYKYQNHLWQYYSKYGDINEVKSNGNVINMDDNSPIIIEESGYYYYIYYKYQNHLWQYYSKYGDINEVKSNGNVINMDDISPIVIDHPNSNYFSIYYKYQNHLWQYYSKYGDINEVKSNGSVINMDYDSDLVINYPNSNYFSLFYKYQNHLWQYYSKYGDINEIKSNGESINISDGTDFTIHYFNTNYFNLYYKNQNHLWNYYSKNADISEVGSNSIEID